MVLKLLPKVLLLDYQMPGPGAYQLEKWVRENYPETITLILTAHDRDAYLAQMINSGASGYLTKNENADQLINAIRRAAEGIIYFSEEQIARALKWKERVYKKWEALTDRERVVLQRLAMGEDNKTIAQTLDISLKTVEFHITKILKKLDMNSRDEVIVWMLKHQPDNSDSLKD